MTKHDDNYKKLLKDLKQLQKASFRWGPVGLNNAKKAIWNEFGTDTIPERPAFRKTFGSRATHSKINNAAKHAIKQIVAGKSFENAAKSIGEVGLAELKKTFTSNIEPPNAPSTIKKKGQGKGTLRDTLELFKSLSYEVIK